MSLVGELDDELNKALIVHLYDLLIEPKDVTVDQFDQGRHVLSESEVLEESRLANTQVKVLHKLDQVDIADDFLLLIILFKSGHTFDCARLGLVISGIAPE